MGRLSITGPAAEGLLERVVTRKIAGMKDGQARYGLACQEDGGTIDDLIVNRMGPEDFLVVCNGANREAVVNHLRSHNEHGADISDDTMGSTMVAVQGPAAVERMTARWPHLAEMKRYRCGLIEHGEHALFVARTGYTGEDGFEIIAPSTATEAIIEVLDDLNQHNVVDAGLGARDSLRLEAAMPLYGHELSETKTPFRQDFDSPSHSKKMPRASLAKKHCDRKPNKAYRPPWLVSTLTRPEPLGKARWSSIKTKCWAK